MEVKKLMKLNGLVLAPDASAYLLSAFSEVSNDVLKRFIDCVLSHPKLDGNRVSKDVCDDILSEWKSESTTSTQFFHPINALEIPRFEYCKTTKKFIPLRSSCKDCRNTLMPATPTMKSFLAASRYEVVYQRVIRNRLFSPDSPGGGFKLRPVEFLLSLGAKENSVVILGVLTQLKNGQWFIEDPTNLVKLDLTQAQFHQGVFPEGVVVMAEGCYVDDVFHVTGIGLPPVENAAATRRYFGVSNPFGGSPLNGPAAADDEKMSRLLDASPDSMVVFLGETRLDSPGCLEKLETIFMGYADFPPAAFVLCGDFASPDYGKYPSDKRTLLKQLFRRLTASYLRAYGDAETRGRRQPILVLLVGPHDPSLSPTGLLPRAPLQPDLFDEYPAWLHLASNPLRMRVYTREIVVFRFDYSRQLLRHCVHLPNTSDPSRPPPALESTDTVEAAATEAVLTSSQGPSLSSDILGQALARCLASQGHLSPLPVHISPVFWPWDQALSLNPLPDLVVAVEPDAIADLNAASSSAAVAVETRGEDPLGGCRFTNPGRFGDSGVGSGARLSGRYTFKVYYPTNQVIEDSRLPS